MGIFVGGEGGGGGGGSGGAAITSTSGTVGTFVSGTPLVVVTPNTAIASGRLHSGAHGLGAVPSQVHVFAENVTADNDYLPGDIIDLTGLLDGFSVRVDATNMYFALNRNSSYMTPRAGSNGGGPRMQETNWTYTLQPYLLKDSTVVSSVSGGGDGYFARAFLYSNVNVIAARSIVTAAVDQVLGTGIAKEEFTIGSITYIGHSLSAGTYFIRGMQGGTHTSPTYDVRTHTAFPTTAAEIETVGTQLGIDPASVHTATFKVFTTTAADTKLWMVPSSSETEIGYILDKIS